MNRRELARLTMEFYRREYIEGLFISSAVEVSPDHTGSGSWPALDLLRNQYGFAGYIHAKLIPGMSPELIHQIGLRADRLSVNIELPTEEGLKRLAPQKQLQNILKPMNQITTTMMEQKTTESPGSYASPDGSRCRPDHHSGSFRKPAPVCSGGTDHPNDHRGNRETDQQIIHTSEKLYHRFVMKRVYYLAYIPVSSSSLLPST